MGKIYPQLLERADLLYLTIVDRDVDDDTFFPSYEHLVGTLFVPVQTEVREGYRFEESRRKLQYRETVRVKRRLTTPYPSPLPLRACSSTCSYPGTAAAAAGLRVLPELPPSPARSPG